jgi:hypothetical protein
VALSKLTCDAVPETEIVVRLAASEERIALRLLALGADGVGGFARGGIDDDPERPLWLVRRVPKERADALARAPRVAWRDALALVGAVARALGACERAALFPGPLDLAQIVTAPAPAWIAAEALVAALLGEPPEARAARTLPSPKWTPPEQGDGAAWDNAANRYVLGLLLYRLIAGNHPFKGGGLRHALAEQASGGAPPWSDEVAQSVRPGVQSFVLKMIEADAAKRPPDAASIVRRIDELLDESVERAEGLGNGARSDRADRSRAAAASRPGRASKGRAAPARDLAPPLRPRPVRGINWMHLAPVAVGIAAAALGVAFAGSKEAATGKPRILPLRPLSATTSSECAACHAREVAEWQRSVMAHAAKSPLYGALESAVEEQIGRDANCPNGAGVLRRAGGDACRDERTGIKTTGSGGEHWCVNCHAMGENIEARMPAWAAFGPASSRAPVRDLLPPSSMEGISCAGCHQTIGPVAAHADAARARNGAAAYEGNATWTSVVTGQTFTARPEDFQGRTGIGNSGYLLDPGAFLLARSLAGTDALVHQRPSKATSKYLASSEFCGACHDVRLFGTDTLGVRERGEHFKRLRNAYSEWRTWADDQARAGRAAATCQDCHMSLYPGTCEPGAGQASGAASDPIGRSCPSGTHFAPRAPGEFPQARMSPTSSPRRAASHFFTSVDLPLTPSYPDGFVDDPSLDAFGLPMGLRGRRDLLLRKAFTFAMDEPRRVGSTLEIPLRIENTGAGHRVPAGFSQEREIWVELTVTDARGAVVYQVGKIATEDADLADKVFLRVSTSEQGFDAKGRPLGIFGADVVDGPDVPRWSPNPQRGGTTFRGRGLVNFQNGFFRCVRCIGFVDAQGACQPGPEQGRTRADRFDDGVYDIDTGECRSNLSAGNELFETYFPVGALDADRGITKAPDAIIDTRSAAPNVPLRYTYEIDVGRHSPPFQVDARLRFRSFPPYLIKAFADYEAKKSSARLRPSGPQVTRDMLRRLEVVDLAEAHARSDK